MLSLIAASRRVKNGLRYSFKYQHKQSLLIFTAHWPTGLQEPLIRLEWLCSSFLLPFANMAYGRSRMAGAALHRFVDTFEMKFSCWPTVLPRTA